MTSRNIRNNSYLFSIVIHLILLGIFFLIKFTITYPPREYVEVGFGNFGPGNSAGAKGTNIEDIQAAPSAEETKKTEKTANIVKEVELPKTKNAQDENVITRAEKTDKNVKPNTKAESSQDVENTSSSSGEGKGSNGDSGGGLGFGIEWGGKGTRKIYSYILPNYPEGVAKEIDVKLRFTILPDGTVGRISPLIKADTRLENAAINSLRQWRFEPLHQNQKQIEQNAVIVFPYRLQ